MGGNAWPNGKAASGGSERCVILGKCCLQARAVRCWRCWMAAKLAVLQRGKTRAKSENRSAAVTTPCRNHGKRSNLTEQGKGRTSSVVSGFASVAKSDMIGVCVLLHEKPLRLLLCRLQGGAVARIKAVIRSVLPSALSPPLLQKSARFTQVSSACQVRAFSCV